MKKILLLLTLIISFTLTGCEEAEQDTLTEAEIEAMVSDLVSQQSDLSAAELAVLIEQLVEERIDEQQATIDYTIEAFEEAVTAMIEEARTGVLGIIVITNTSSGTGSGVVYKREPITIIDDDFNVVQGWKYYMVTNDHVLVHESPIGERMVPVFMTVVYEKNGLLFEIENEVITYLGSDPVTDLGVITFESAEDFKVIEFADSYDIQAGQFVFAIGNPLGFDYYGTVTMGVISGTARYYMEGDFDATLLQHDAAISPGNSGGALLDINGDLVGINNMKIVEEYVANIGFAIPSNTVERIATDLEDDGIVTRPYLGITTSAQVNQCGYDFGVCIEVLPGGAAEAALLEDYDLIIGYKNEGMDDFLEINNFNDLREAILNSSVGESIIIQYVRDDIEHESIPTTLNVHPDDQ